MYIFRQFLPYLLFLVNYLKFAKSMGQLLFLILINQSDKKMLIVSMETVLSFKYNYLQYDTVQIIVCFF